MKAYFPIEGATLTQVQRDILCIQGKASFTSNTFCIGRILKMLTTRIPCNFSTSLS